MRVWSSALPTPVAPPPRVMRAAETIWARMVADRAMAGPTLARALRDMRTLGSKERPAVGDLLLGLIRHERALARLDADPLRAWLRLAAEGPPDLDDPVDAYAIAVSLPDDLAAEWWERLGPELAVAHGRVMAGRAPVCLRVLKDPVELPVPHRREGASIVLEGRTNLDLVPAYQQGRVEVQDLGSQRIAEAAFPGPGARVLDLCAGAGGKTLALAALGAHVDAWDIRPGALGELRRRAARANLRVRIGEPKGRYDVVLVDAPCSGTGVLRRHPENRWKLRFPTDEQRGLLEYARTLGDRVVYATCALTLRENEEMVRSVAEPLREETLWPEEGGRDGFYVAELAGT